MKGFRCFRCSELSDLSPTFCYYCLSEEGISEDIPGLDFPVLSDMEDGDFGISELEENVAMKQKDILTKTEDSHFQEQKIAFQDHEQNSAEINPAVTLDSSANKGETMLAGPRGGENISGMVKSKEFDISLPRAHSRAVDISDRSRDNLASSDTVYIQIKKITKNSPACKRRIDEMGSVRDEDHSNDSQQRDNPMKLGSINLISIDNSYIDQKLSSGISDPGPSKGVNVDDDLAVAGPSGFQSNRQHRNSYGRIPRSNYASEIQSIRMREQYLLTCKVCKMDVEAHLVDGNVYRCCVCKFDAFKQVNLQMHSYTHCPVKICNICGKEYTEGDLHDSEQICRICKNEFHCRTRYGLHLLDHPQYLWSYCWACSERLSRHWIIEKEEEKYACCFCNHNNDKLQAFQDHCLGHHPKFYCRICREEYSTLEKEKNLHDGEYKCLFCLEKYQCQTLLEEHTLDHKEFTKICILCYGEIEKHVNRRNRKKYCCQCRRVFSTSIGFQSHLQEHTGLRLFKCESCGERFRLEEQAKLHSKNCMLYKCEICGVTFPNRDSLDLHRSEIHIQI